MFRLYHHYLSTFPTEYLQNIRPDLFLSNDDENLDTQTKIFVDDNSQSLVDDFPDIKPDIKTDVDTIDYTSDTEFVKTVPQHPCNSLKCKIKRKTIKKEKNKSKRKASIQKTIKNVFDDFESTKPVINIKDEIIDVDFDSYEDKKPKIKDKVKDVIFENVEPKFIKKFIKTVKDKDLEIAKEIIDLVNNTDDAEFIMEVLVADPKFIKEVIDLTKENNPEIVKKVIDLTRDGVKEEVDLTDSDPKFIKEIINLTKDNNATLVKKVIELKKEIVDAGGKITIPMLKELIIFKDDVDVRNKPKIVKNITDLTNSDGDIEFIKEIIDVAKRGKRKKRKRKQKTETIKDEKKKEKGRPKKNKLSCINLKVARKNSELLKKNLYEFDLKTMLNKF